MWPTPYADVNALIDDILSAMLGILGRKPIGLYTFGSLATGDFEYELSDIDLVAALTADLNDEEFAQLERMHANIAGRHRRWDDRIEVGYISTRKLRRIEPDAEIALISPGEPFHFKQAGNDWLFNLYTLREDGDVVYGPPPRTLIDPIGNEDLVHTLRPLMREWREWITQTPLVHQRQYQGHMVITLCRALYLFRNGEPASKPRAAAWAAAELPRWSSLIRDALVWREARAGEHVDQDATLPRTLRFVRFVIDSILAGEPDGAPRSGTAAGLPTAP